MNTNPGPLDRIPHLPRHERAILAPLLFELGECRGNSHAVNSTLERIKRVTGRDLTDLIAILGDGGLR